jgi:CubicO group peptidase (beta-lactamase class C family)
MAVVSHDAAEERRSRGGFDDDQAVMADSRSAPAGALVYAPTQLLHPLGHGGRQGAHEITDRPLLDQIDQGHPVPGAPTSDSGWRGRSRLNRRAATGSPLVYPSGMFSMICRGLAVSMFVWGVLSVVVSGLAQAAELDRLLQNGRVPGLAFAVVRDGKIAELGAIGARDTSTGIPVDENTIFEAASLSKPVFAYAVLQLVDKGILSLDTPLSKYAPDFVTGDSRASSITVGHVLGQTSGLPNWRSWLNPLRTHFNPGTHFSYSGEGFIWLQQAVVAATGETLNGVMARLVFEPLKMKDTSYTWRADFEGRFAAPHDGLDADGKTRPVDPLVAYTLHTTAADYGRFLQAVLSGSRLRHPTFEQWLQPRIVLRQRCIECLDPDARDGDQGVAWGLGWGLEPRQGSFFHWGDNGGFKSFATGSLASRSAVVVLTNGSNGMAIMPEVIRQLLPGEHPAFTWLDYDRSPSRGWLGWVR